MLKLRMVLSAACLLAAATAVRADHMFDLAAYENGERQYDYDREYDRRVEVNYASMSEVNALRAELLDRIHDLERRAADDVGSYGGCDGGDKCKCDACCDPCWRSHGLVIGAEVSYIKPHHGQGTGLTFGQVFNVDTRVETDYEWAPRIWVGYTGCDGFGVRARYWEFDHTFASPVFDDQGIQLGEAVHLFDINVYDAEFTTSSKLGCNWDATLSAGFRHVEFKQARAAIPINGNGGPTAFGNIFRGYGLTIGGELRQRVFGNWGFFVNSRGSALFGDERQLVAFNFLVPIAGELEEINTIKYIWEAQAGFEWRRCIDKSAYVYARGAAEVQYWDEFAGIGFGQAVGFGGFTGSIGIVR